MALVLILGPMFADKTNTLIDFIEDDADNGQLVVKPTIDNRYLGSDKFIISHSGRQTPAQSIDPTDFCHVITIARNTDVKNIYIDEVHFFGNIASMIKELLAMDINIVAAGINIDYRGIPFEQIEQLEQLAKTVILLKSTCECGKLAPYTAMKKTLSQELDRIVVGGAEKYYPSCKKCHPIID